MWRSIGACALSAAGVAAQIPGNHALVLSASSNPGIGCELYDADLVTGNVRNVGRFSSDGLVPLAVTIDPVQGDAILALENFGTTRVVRLRLPRGNAGAETVLATFPGVATDVAISWQGRIYCVTGGDVGALFEIPRTGGAYRVVLSTPGASAIGDSSLYSGVLLIALSGDPQRGTDPGVMFVDALAGSPTVPPFYFTGHQPRGLTGITYNGSSSDLTFLDEGGNAWRTLLPSAPFAYSVSPLPPGGTAAVVKRNLFELVVLGRAVHPYLKTIQAVSGLTQSWNLRAGPIPGDPVDFGLQAPLAPASYGFGAGCARGLSFPPFLEIPGVPRLGSSGFFVALHFAPPRATALLLLGSSDQRAFGSVPLPLALPGGCELLVSSEFLLPATTDPSGDAVFPLPIPRSPELAGTYVFAQWITASPSFQLSTSDPLSLHLAF